MLAVYLLLFLFGSVFSNWVNRAELERPQEYYRDVITAAFHEIEEVGWSSLKVDDLTQDIDEELYALRVQGKVTYTNGFLVSIQNLTIDKMSGYLTTRTDGSINAIITGTVHFEEPKIGFDVTANLTDGIYGCTGIFPHTNAQYSIQIVKNLDTKEFTASSSLSSLGTNISRRMIYMPSSNITEALSRNYVASSSFDSFAAWGRTIATKVQTIASEKIQFPRIIVHR